MSTTQVDCPKCGLEESLDVSVVDDQQGDGIWSAPITFMLVDSQECDCALTDDELDAAFDMIDVEAIRDRYE